MTATVESSAQRTRACASATRVPEQRNSPSSIPPTLPPPSGSPSLADIAQRHNGQLTKPPSLWMPRHLTILGVAVHRTSNVRDTTPCRERARSCMQNGSIDPLWIHNIRMRLGYTDAHEHLENCLRWTLKTYQTNPSIDVLKNEKLYFQFGHVKARMIFPILVRDAKDRDPLLAFISGKRLGEMRLEESKGREGKVRAYHRACQQQLREETPPMLASPMCQGSHVAATQDLACYTGFIIAMAQEKYRLGKECSRLSSSFWCTLAASNEDNTGWRVYTSSVPRPFIESFLHNRGAFEPGIVINYCDIPYNSTEVFLDFIRHTIGIDHPLSRAARTTQMTAARHVHPNPQQPLDESRRMSITHCNSDRSPLEEIQSYQLNI